MKINQLQYHGKDWDEMQRELYKTIDSSKARQLIIECAILLSQEELFHQVLQKAIKKYKTIAKFIFQTQNRNYLAWLGYIACYYKYKTPECFVRIAWTTLSNKQKRKANQIASYFIRRG